MSAISWHNALSYGSLGTDSQGRIPFSSSQKLNIHFLVCSAVMEGAAVKAGVSRCPANKNDA